MKMLPLIESSTLPTEIVSPSLVLKNPYQSRLKYLASHPLLERIDGRDINRRLSIRCKKKITARHWFKVEAYPELMPEGVQLMVEELTQARFDQIYIVDYDFQQSWDPFLVVILRPNNNDGSWESSEIECNEHCLVM